MELTVEPVSVSVEECVDDNNEVSANIKLQVGNVYETNLVVSIADLELLSKVRGSRWDRRESIAIGECAGVRAFWCSDEEGFSVLIGHDDETWDTSFWLPLSTLDEIIRESESLTS